VRADARNSRNIEKLTWVESGRRVTEYLALVERRTWPELIIVGGGVSVRHRQFFKYLRPRAELAPAALRNEVSSSDRGAISQSERAAAGGGTRAVSPRGPAKCENIASFRDPHALEQRGELRGQVCGASATHGGEQ